MQRMEVIIRYVDDEDQVLSESNMSFQMLDVNSIPQRKLQSVLTNWSQTR